MDLGKDLYFLFKILCYNYLYIPTAIELLDIDCSFP